MPRGRGKGRGKGKKAKSKPAKKRGIRNKSGLLVTPGRNTRKTVPPPPP